MEGTALRPKLDGVQKHDVGFLPWTSAASSENARLGDEAPWRPFVEPTAPAPAAPAAAWSVRYTTEDDEVVKKSLAQVGVAYYYNLETSVAQWTCPEGFTSAETAASAASRARS